MNCKEKLISLSTKLSCAEYIIFFVVLLFSLNALYFGYEVHSSYIRADQWRFIGLYLNPIHNNTFEIKMLWSDQHPEPLTAILFILSEYFSDLTINLYFYIGILGKILFIFLFILLFLKYSSNSNSYIKIFFIILITSTFFSLKSINEYAWPLVTLSNIWLFIFLIILYQVDRFFKGTKSHLLLIVLLVFYLIFVRDLAMISIASILAIYIIISLLDKNYRNLGAFILAIIISFIIFKLFYIVIGVEQQHSSKSLFSFETFNIIGAINSYAIGIFSGLFNLDILKKIGLPNIIILFLSYIFLIAYIGVVLFYLKHKLYRRTAIPLILMLFSLVYLTAILLYRYYPNSMDINWLVTSPRYTKIYEIGVIAMFWALFISYESLHKKNEKRIHEKILFFILSLVIIFNIFSIIVSFRFSKYVIKSNKRTEQTLIKYINLHKANKIPKLARGCFFTDKKIQFLKNNKLNVFSEKY